MWLAVSEFRRGARASPLPGATLPDLAERKTFRNSRGHGFATVAPWSVSAFLLDKSSVGTPLLQRGQRSPHAEHKVIPTKPGTASFLRSPVRERRAGGALARFLVSTLALAMTLAVGAGGCGSREESQPAASTTSRESLKARVEEVRAVQFPIVVEVTGQVAAVTQATLSSKIQGMVLEVRVREGTLVSKGQILVTLDSRDLRANLARADAELENAKAHLARMKRLYAQESVAKQELDNATRSFKVAEATKQAAQAQLSYTVIKAPFDGIVTEKRIEVGELAAPGQPMLKIEDPKRARLEATVAEGDLRSVTLGGKVPIVIDALGEQPLTGTVAQVLPSGDPATHTFLVKVDLPSTPGLRTGMFGRMQLGKGSSQTLAISKPGIIERGQLTGVFVVGQDNIMRLRWVKVGRTRGTSVEILSGLNPGERVLADATQGQDGGRVEITEVVAVPAPQKP